MTIPAAIPNLSLLGATQGAHMLVAWVPPLILLAVVWMYFINNPLQHGAWFMIRRFINWFPLGMTYAFSTWGATTQPQP